MQVRKEHSWMERYAPLGIELAKEVMLYVSTMTIAVLYSFSYFFDYINYRNALFEQRNGVRIISEGALMVEFDTLMEGRMILFWVVIASMVGIIIYHYFYHHMNSKMIYLMKRLPSKWEYHKRCLTLPIAGIVVTGIVSIVLQLLYLGVYLLFTPQQCLPL